MSTRVAVKSAVLFALLIVMFTRAAFAFKAETHIWLADQIIAELESRKNYTLTLTLTSRTIAIEVPPHIREAILSHPEAFRLGNIGPDAFPGILEGQTAIHPGSENWGTGEWLEHIVGEAKTPEEISFAYGFVAHAAADVWAHSYVNHYSGDVFDLTDGELLNEARHVLIEGYIANHTPWSTDFPHTDYNSLRASLMRDGKYAIPHEYLFRVFIDSRAAAESFDGSDNSHLSAVHKLYHDLDDLTRPGGLADSAHKLAQNIVLANLVGWTFTTEELDQLDKLHQEILNAESKGIEELQELLDAMRAFNRSKIGAELSRTEDLLSQADDALVDARKALRAAHEVENAILDLQRQIDNLSPTVTIQRSLDVLLGFESERITNPAIDPLRTAIREKQVIERRFLAEVSASGARAKTALEQLHRTLLAAYDAESRSVKAAVDLKQRTSQYANPIASYIQAWRADIRNSMFSYFDANADAVVRAMSGESALTPLLEWQSCDAVKIAGVPGSLADASCAGESAYAELLNFFDAVARIEPLNNEVLNFRDRIVGEIAGAAKTEGLKYASQVTGVAFEAFLTSLESNATASDLNRSFSDSAGSTDLLVVPSISEIIDADMHLSASNHFDVKRFHPIANSLDLIKLSMSSPKRVSVLFGQKGDPPLPEDFNIMFRFARSIDGDYQWMQHGPPYARSSGPHERASDDYGYGERNLVWSTPKARETFRKIFSGPLAESFVGAQFDSILPPDYPFRPNDNCTYPTVVHPPSCN